MVCYVDPVVVSYVEFCKYYGCESLCVILSQILLIVVCYIGPVVVNHGVLCCASCCGLW